MLANAVFYWSDAVIIASATALAAAVVNFVVVLYFSSTFMSLLKLLCPLKYMWTINFPIHLMPRCRCLKMFSSHIYFINGKAVSNYMVFHFFLVALRFHSIPCSQALLLVEMYSQHCFQVLSIRSQWQMIRKQLLPSRHLLSFSFHLLFLFYFKLFV